MLTKTQINDYFWKRGSAGPLFLLRYILQNNLKKGNQRKVVNLLRAVVTVIGQDKIGIIAAVSQKLAELNINIVDVSQTIMQGNFTMMMMVSVPDKSDFDGIRSALQTTGTTLGVQIRIQREEIFTAMHEI